jgi:predicted MPP superfamily phosphohydrolase
VPDAVKILMSHDPSHFDAVVKKHPKNIQLTLSGHTHGMQFGIDSEKLQMVTCEIQIPEMGRPLRVKANIYIC